MSHTHKCIHEWFESQASLKPDALALIFNNNCLTYKELNNRANQICVYLRESGVSADTLVGLYLEPSIEMIIGILAILKAGGAYVPLDPNYPDERLNFILFDSNISILLSNNDLPESLSDKDIQVINLKNNWTNSLIEHDTNPNNITTENNLAYVIYTSGTTGKPKGVLVTHENLISSTPARLSYYRNPPACLLSLYSFSFDPSVAAIFWILSVGGILVIPHKDFQQDPTQTINLIHEHHVTHLMCLPSIYSLILDIALPEQLDSLQSIIVGGEAFNQELIKQHKTKLNKTSFYNEYGPTETTIWCAVHDYHSNESEAIYTIGKPIPHVHIYILDENQQMVPNGEKGEIHIGGKIITKGYLNHPKLTKQKFIPDPFNEVYDSKLYKSGDLGRYLPNGTIEFFGRQDNQVKIRGYRIELGEIENTLLLHPSVTSAAVQVIENDTKTKQLIAYLVCKHGRIPGILELRTFISSRLPIYMLPQAFIFMDRLPVDENGKLDRKALPIPETKSNEINHLPPRNKYEEQLATIWQSILKISKVSINSDFFILGGDSLLAAHIIVQIEQTFDVNISLINIYENPTISELSSIIIKKIKIRKEQEDIQLAKLLEQIENMDDEEIKFQLNNKND